MPHRPEDIEIIRGRAVGGDFMRATHKPTGISRAKGPPLESPAKAKAELLQEIEAELIRRGLGAHIFPPAQTRKAKR